MRFFEAERQSPPGSAKESFRSGFEHLKWGMERVCAEEVDWQEKIVVGIQTALQFAATHPDDVRAVTVDAASSDQDEVIDYFVDLLTGLAPEGARFPISADRAIVESIALIVRSHVMAGSPEELPGLAPDLAYLALLPYTGLDGARRGAVGTPAGT